MYNSSQDNILDISNIGLYVLSYSCLDQDRQQANEGVSF